jgi:hypothetical protein
MCPNHNRRSIEHDVSRENRREGLSGARSTIEVLDPPRRFAITDLSQEPLSGWEMGMSQYDFAHDLDWDSVPQSVSSCVPPEIVRPQFDIGELSCFLDDNPGGRIRDRKNPLLRLKRSLLDVSTQTLHHLSRNEDNLSVLAALWTLYRQLMVAYIFRGELQDFADPHASPGHQFQDKSVSQLRCPEDDFIDRLFFDNPQWMGLPGL